MANKIHSIGIKAIYLLVGLVGIISLTSCVTVEQKKVTLFPEKYDIPAELDLRVYPHPEIPDNADIFPKVSVVFTAGDFNVPKEKYIAVELHHIIGKEGKKLRIEIEELYFVDYYADRIGVAKRSASAAAVASVSPVVSAILSGDTRKANGVIFIVGKGRVNGHAFNIKTEFPYLGINDPALNDKQSYMATAQSALKKAAQEIATNVSKVL